jgi:anion-transporting  ArsA/GET3 family ATPase
MQGKKTLVLTVDPAKRLATTLNIKDDGEDHQVDLQNKDLFCLNGEKQIEGELWASVLNSRKIFDDFVLKSSSKRQGIEKLFHNKLYQQLSTTLSGSQEFTSIEKLYSSYKSGKYDLIILDTPPTKHAIDFLEAPKKISQLFNESITKWFQKPIVIKDSFLGQLFQTGTEKVFQILQTLTGSDFVFELRDFFLNVESWQKDLENRSIEIHKILTQTETSFNLVTAFDAAKIHEASYFANEILKTGHHLRSLTMNRSYPSWLPKPFLTGSSVDQFCIKLNSYYKQRLDTFEAMTQDFQTLEVLVLPEYENDISDLSGLKEVTQDWREWKGH